MNILIALIILNGASGQYNYNSNQNQHNNYGTLVARNDHGSQVESFYSARGNERNDYNSPNINQQYEPRNGPISNSKQPDNYDVDRTVSFSSNYQKLTNKKLEPIVELHEFTYKSLKPTIRPHSHSKDRNVVHLIQPKRESYFTTSQSLLDRDRSVELNLDSSTRKSYESDRYEKKSPNGNLNADRLLSTSSNRDNIQNEKSIYSNSGNMKNSNSYYDNFNRNQSFNMYETTSESIFIEKSKHDRYDQSNYNHPTESVSRRSHWQTSENRQNDKSQTVNNVWNSNVQSNNQNTKLFALNNQKNGNSETVNDSQQPRYNQRSSSNYQTNSESNNSGYNENQQSSSKSPIRNIGTSSHFNINNHDSYERMNDRTNDRMNDRLAYQMNHKTNDGMNHKMNDRTNDRMNDRMNDRPTTEKNHRTNNGINHRNDRTDDRINDRTNDRMHDKPTKEMNHRTNDEMNHRINDSTNNRINEGATNEMNHRTNDGINHKINHRTNDRINDRTNDRINDRRNDRTDGKNDRLNDMINDRTNYTVNDRTNDRINDRRNDRKNDGMNERKNDNINDKINERTYENQKQYSSSSTTSLYPYNSKNWNDRTTTKVPILNSYQNFATNSNQNQNEYNSPNIMKINTSSNEQLTKTNRAQRRHSSESNNNSIRPISQNKPMDLDSGRVFSSTNNNERNNNFNNNKADSIYHQNERSSNENHSSTTMTQQYGSTASPWSNRNVEPTTFKGLYSNENKLKNSNNYDMTTSSSGYQQTSKSQNSDSNRREVSNSNSNRQSNYELHSNDENYNENKFHGSSISTDSKNMNHRTNPTSSSGNIRSNQDSNLRNTENISKRKKRVSQQKYEEYMRKIYGDDDEPDSFDTRIISDSFDGRKIVEPGQYPHMVAIGFRTNDRIVDWKCGGSLIDEYFVLTAAHCTEFNGQKPSHVKIGDINLKVNEGTVDPQRIRVRDVYNHPRYNDSSYYNDIALIKLTNPAEFTEFVQPIRLWEKQELQYKTVFAMGYGATAFGKAKTNILTDLNMTIVSNNECDKILPDMPEAKFGILSSQVCAIDPVGNRDTCQGDSGGPLQLNLEGRRRIEYHLIGITSYGVLCGGRHPSVYTRVSSFLDWIEGIVWPAN